MSELGYDAAGDGDPALLFLHGWCGDRSFFAPQFDHFSAAHRVVAVDLPGHGKSEVPAEYEIEAFAAEVAALARRLELGRSVVFGHSLGAMVALALAQQAPELVGAVAMIDPPPLSKEVWKGFAAAHSVVPGPRRAGGTAELRRADVPAHRQRRTPRPDHRDHVRCPTTSRSRWCRRWPAFDAMAILRESDVPMLTISSAVPTNDAASLLEANPTMTLGQTVGAGHFHQLEVPEQVNPMIERFLAVIPGGALATP